jgi:two-component system response regulator AtoC
MISEYQEIAILLIEDEDFDVRRVENTLKPFADRIRIKEIVADGQSALEAIRKQPQTFDVIIMDYQIAGGLSGVDLIRAIKKLSPSTQIIVITKMTTNITDFSFANRLLEAGAIWYCTKYPGDIEDYIYQPTDFILSIFNAMMKKQLEQEKEKNINDLNQKIDELLDGKEIIGASEAIRSVRDKISRYADHDATVLIQGASGTGKELVANHIHYLSHRRLKRFMPINCGSLPAHLIESELFGYEKGAFTGATARKLGLLELADGGTVFLDEIAELPPEAQVKLLRFLQEGEIDRIGRTEHIKVDVRIIAATNRDVARAMQEKKLREDLFYRLNVAPVRVPALRERSSDIRLLTEHFLTRYATQMSVAIPNLSAAAWQSLETYAWPGNVRQLQNCVQRLLLTGNEEIASDDVHQALGMHNNEKNSGNGYTEWFGDSEIKPLREVERTFRENYFKFVRQQTHSDAEAARQLGLAPPNYYRMCKELGLK